MSPLIRDLENCLVLPFFQGSRLLKLLEVLLTDSNLTETDLIDSLTLIHRKLDRGCCFNSPFNSKVLDFSNFAQLLSEQLRKKLHFFILLRYCSFAQGNLNAFVRSKICFLLNIVVVRQRMIPGEWSSGAICVFAIFKHSHWYDTKCVTSAWAKWYLSLVFMIITKCRREN